MKLLVFSLVIFSAGIAQAQSMYCESPMVVSAGIYLNSQGTYDFFIKDQVTGQGFEMAKLRCVSPDHPIYTCVGEKGSYVRTSQATNTYGTKITVEWTGINVVRKFRFKNTDCRGQ